MSSQQTSFAAKLGSTLWNLATIAACAFVLYLADVVGVMRYSQRIYTSLLHLSYCAYGLFFLIWIYLAGIVSWKNPNWENTHMQYIYVATAAVSVGGVTWTIALWPVFHIWTIPLGLVALFMFLSAVSLLPASKRKGE
jgi:hypothetical protein